MAVRAIGLPCRVMITVSPGSTASSPGPEMLLQEYWFCHSWPSSNSTPLGPRGDRECGVERRAGAFPIAPIRNIHGKCLFLRLRSEAVGDIETAKLFKHGGSQAVRLPKDYRLPGKEVRVRRLGRGVH
jgi:hypothetical protein